MAGNYFRSYFKNFSFIKILILLTIIASLFLAINQFQLKNVKAHSSVADPKEIFSIWNNTAPNIDGYIKFSPYSSSEEWCSAAIYDFYNSLNKPEGKIIIQNSDNYFYVAFDMLKFTSEFITQRSATIYFDTDQNGLLTFQDKAITFRKDLITVVVELLQPLNNKGDWLVIESGLPGIPLPISNIIANQGFDYSTFNNATEHWMYEFSIPLNILQKNLGDIIGVGFYASNGLITSSNVNTWPYSSLSTLFGQSAKHWGDLYLGEQFNYSKYVIEDNFLIKSTATGENNNTFLTTADIEGDGQQELVVCSNREVAGDTKLIAIYDLVDGKLTRIWASWTSALYSSLFHITGIAAYDFNGNGRDELYCVSDSDSRIGRLHGWNTITKDFTLFDIIFENYGDSLLGYIDIGDVSNNWDGSQQIIFGDELGYIGILNYKSNKNLFELLGYISPYGSPYRIHDIEVAHMDIDYDYPNEWQEVLFLSQYENDNSDSPTHLQIIEVDGTYWGDNYYLEDNLGKESNVSTQDKFGHSIIVADVDNDDYMETIIAGKDYLKIFTPFSFDQPSPPIEFLINDGTNPLMGGGAAVFDIDDDYYNELIVGCNNGTTIIYEFIDSTYDSEYIPIDYFEEWRGDIGSSPGYRNAIIGMDIDLDGVKEAIIGDNFGQIIVLGLGPYPSLTITYPSYGYVTNQNKILLKWNTSDETLQMHHYEIYINGAFACRVGGGQTQHLLSLVNGYNDIEIYGVDITGDWAYDYTLVIYTIGAPEVSITWPYNYYIFREHLLHVEWTFYEPDNQVVYFNVYLNDSKIASNWNYTYYDIDFPTPGLYNITIEAVDTDGLAGKDNIFVIMDDVPPEITITSPMNGEAIGFDTIELQWEAFDSLSGVYFYYIYQDSEYLGYSYSPYYTIYLPSDKEYTLEVEAYDYAYNYQSSFISIQRDTISPSIDLLPLSLPMQDYWYYTANANQVIEWDGFDNYGGSGIDYFELKINSLLYSYYPEQQINATVNLGTEGFKEVVIYAYDRAGNYDIDYYTIVVDSTSPLITITSPPDDYQTSSSSVVINWNSNDLGTGVKEHRIYVNGTLFDTIDSTVFNYNLNLNENNNYTITIRAYDYLNRNSESTIHVRQNPLAPTFLVLNPWEYYSYSQSTITTLIWDTINIYPDFYHIFVNGTFYGSYDPTAYNATIDFEMVFGDIPENQFPIANVTIAIFIGTSYQYVETRWITIDQSIPSLAILNPFDNSIIYEKTFELIWSGYDTGSGIAGYIGWLNNNVIGYWSNEISSSFIDISGYADGLYTLTLQTFDFAGNAINKSINLELYPEAPEFSVDIPNTIITNNPNFNVNLTIYNPRIGVGEIVVIADGSEEVFSINYNGSLQYNPYWLDFEVSGDDLVTPGDLHNLSITVYDGLSRYRNMIIGIIIDMIAPSVFGSPILDEQLFDTEINFIEISEDIGENNHTITITTRDTYGISRVNILLAGNGVNNTFDMIFDPDQSVGEFYVFTYNLQLDGYSIGNYSLTFIIYDLAGNSYNSSFLLSLEAGKTNWFLDHLYTIVIPVGAGILVIILLSTILSVATKKQRINRGWQEALDAVAYVTKTGLTLAYVPYSKDLFEDEQLFGGALTGVVGILGEITGEKELRMETQILEFGEKRLMVCSGIYGIGILLVKNVKPILKEHLRKFLLDFELTYKTILTQELIDLNEFSAVPILVESIFGFRKNIYTPSIQEKFNAPAEQTLESDNL